MEAIADPQSIINQSLDKQRIVVTGTRGMTAITALLIHVLDYHKRSFDYVIREKVGTITNNSRFTDAPLIIIDSGEHDMLQYKHHIGLICNIMWSTSEEFATEDDYVKQFDLFADSTPKGGMLLYCENDPLALLVGAKPRPDVLSVGYKIHPHTSESGNHFLTLPKEKVPVEVYGSQNFQNITGAKELLKRLGITHEMFYQAVPSFTV